MFLIGLFFIIKDTDITSYVDHNTQFVSADNIDEVFRRSIRNVIQMVQFITTIKRLGENSAEVYLKLCFLQRWYSLDLLWLLNLSQVTLTFH